MPDDDAARGEHELDHARAAKGRSHDPHAERENPDADVDRNGHGRKGEQQRHPHRRPHDGQHPQERRAPAPGPRNRTRHGGQVVEHGLCHLAGCAHGGHGLLLAHAVLHAVGYGLRVERLGLLHLLGRQAGEQLAQPAQELIARHGAPPQRMCRSPVRTATRPGTPRCAPARRP